MKCLYDKDNIKIYNTDCLDLLKEIDSNSISLIYCDIPYNSGLVFDKYTDNLGSPKEAIDYFKPRFIEMKRVLKDNGSIFIHCHWRLDSYIRILLDEIFGYKNFRNRIYRKHSNNNHFYKNFDCSVDVIYYYCKDRFNYVFNEEISDKELVVPLYANGYYENDFKKYHVLNQELDLKKYRKHLLVSEKELSEIEGNGELIIKDGLPYRKSKTNYISNLWDTIDMFDNYDKTSSDLEFDTPKPDGVVEKIITVCSNPGDMVADFFMGSGTTLLACKKLGRRGIFSDISLDTCNYVISRLEK